MKENTNHLKFSEDRMSVQIIFGKRESESFEIHSKAEAIQAITQSVDRKLISEKEGEEMLLEIASSSLPWETGAQKNFKEELFESMRKFTGKLLDYIKPPEESCLKLTPDGKHGRIFAVNIPTEVLEKKGIDAGVGLAFVSSKSRAMKILEEMKDLNVVNLSEFYTIKQQIEDSMMDNYSVGEKSKLN